MDFNVVTDKKVQAVIDPEFCINCGECREICPMGAIEECQKTVYCAFADCGEGKGEESPVKAFQEAKTFALNSACSTGCPLGVVPQAVAACISQGNIKEAYALISDKNPMPWTCSQVCEQFCGEKCKRGQLIDRPLNMAALEDYVLSREEPRTYRYKNRMNGMIAVIGGGPAGITAAFELSRAGYRVTIFEKDDRLGGAMSWGIPGFRLDKEKMAEEIQRIISPGIEVRYNCDIGMDYTLDSIWEEGFDACLIAVGASYGIRGSIPGVDGEMVYTSVEVMKSLSHTGYKQCPIGERVVVAGSSGAVDMARILVRMGKQVVCASTEYDDSSHNINEEAEAAKREGVEFKKQISAKQIIREGDIVKAVEFVKVQYIEDEIGQLKPHIIKGSEFNVFCDTVIFASGRRSSVEKISKVETYPSGKVKIDSCHRTNKNMVFACGEVTGESDSVVEAMAAGRQAAGEIDNALQKRRLPGSHHSIVNAADGQTIYFDNIRRTRPQYREVIISGSESPKSGHIDDILPMLRSAGIEEKMPVFARDEAMPAVAIAGGGIAGVTAAISLAKKGYRPTIFEKYCEPGGTYRWLATEKRVDRSLLEGELAKVEASGIQVIYNAAVGVKPSLDDLWKLGYKAVLFAIGESAGSKPTVENSHCEGVFDMVTLMGKLADREIIDGVGDNVLVTGSDEMAFDIARLLKRYCSKVTLMAPCSRGGLQVATSAVNVAVDEGVDVITGVELSRINAADGKVKSADFKILENKLSMNIVCDTIVLGGTGKPDTETIAVRNKTLRIDEKGYMTIDSKLSTTVPGVFAIGDFNMSSPDAGRAGAMAIDNFLAHGGLDIDVEFNGHREISVTHEKISGNSQTTGGFETGKTVLNGASALAEASRCMGCGYHIGNVTECMGCGVCMKKCPSDAIKLVSAEAAELGKGAGWPDSKDIDDFIGRELSFTGEVE